MNLSTLGFTFIALAAMALATQACAVASATQNADNNTHTVVAVKSSHKRGIRVLEHIFVGDAPVLISRPAEFHTDTKLVVLFHGFGPPENPERLAEAIPLDGTNLIGAYVNMPMIAARLPTGGIKELQRLQMDDFVNGLYFRSILGAASELPSLVGQVASTYGVDTSRGIGLFGFSAGGSAALLALTETDVPVTAVVVVNAPQSVRQNVATWEKELKHFCLGRRFRTRRAAFRRKCARARHRQTQATPRYPVYPGRSG